MIICLQTIGSIKNRLTPFSKPTTLSPDGEKLRFKPMLADGPRNRQSKPKFTQRKGAVLKVLQINLWDFFILSVQKLFRIRLNAAS